MHLHCSHPPLRAPLLVCIYFWIFWVNVNGDSTADKQGGLEGNTSRGFERPRVRCRGFGDHTSSEVCRPAPLGKKRDRERGYIPAAAFRNLSSFFPTTVCIGTSLSPATFLYISPGAPGALVGLSACMASLFIPGAWCCLSHHVFPKMTINAQQRRPDLRKLAGSDDDECLRQL